ncbi:radical SAM family heme chaperone HemW [Halomonas cibimaris]
MAKRRPPLSLYIHTPWCVRKCPYCDFNSHESGRRALPERDYLAALLEDLDQDLPLAGERELVSIFIGGGTPSLLSPEFYQTLLSAISARLAFAANIEITMEANPGTTEYHAFSGYRAAGINRLSFGVQSFQRAQLKALGRIHDGEEAVRAVEQARAGGFDNLNIDLMHGLPGQTPALALDDLEQALALAPEHLSWYQLTLEPNTAFYARPPVLPEEDTLYDIQELGHRCLEQAGLSRYEISAYARPGHESRHNLNYWTFGDYLGIGAGAHGKLSDVDRQGRWTIERRWKTRQPEAYLQRRWDMRGFVAGKREVPADELPLEFCMNALRLTEGVDAARWPAHTGQPLGALQVLLQDSVKKGLLQETSNRLQPTPQGLLFLNELLADISNG